MSYPYTNLYGDISVTVTYNSVDIKMDVSAGLPVVEQLADVLIRHGLTKQETLNGNGKFAYKLQHVEAGNADLTYGETFAQQGVHDGDTLLIAGV